MYLLSLLLVLGADDPADALAKKMLPTYAKDAAESRSPSSPPPRT